MTLQQQSTTTPKIVEEQILVVKTNLLFPTESWQGIKSVDHGYYADLIQSHKEFHPRSLMENDPTYKQIIPYLLFEHKDQFFVMQRRSQASETRLQNKLSLGIGGHIRMEDLADGTIAHWAHREFAEEVSYSGTYTIEPIGIINDDSNSVGKVHIGFVYLLHGNSSNIAIKSEHKSGQLLTLEQCKPLYPQMESWSQIVLDFLK